MQEPPPHKGDALCCSLHSNANSAHAPLQKPAEARWQQPLSASSLPLREPRHPHTLTCDNNSARSESCSNHQREFASGRQNLLAAGCKSYCADLVYAFAITLVSLSLCSNVHALNSEPKAEALTARGPPDKRPKRNSICPTCPLGRTRFRLDFVDVTRPTYYYLLCVSHKMKL